MVIAINQRYLAQEQGMQGEIDGDWFHISIPTCDRVLSYKYIRN